MKLLASAILIISLCACSDKDHPVVDSNTTTKLSTATSATAASVNFDQDSCPEKIQNTYACELLIEGKLAKQYSGIIKRIGPKLEIKLSNGKEIEFADDHEEDYSSFMLYAFEKYFPEIDYGVLYLQLYEGQSYDLINMRTGERTNVGGKVVLSSDKHRLAVFFLDIDANFVSNMLAVYFVTSNGLVKEYEISPSNWGVEDLKWIDSKTIVYNHVSRDSESNLRKEAHNLRFNGNDISTTGKWVNDDPGASSTDDSASPEKSLDAVKPEKLTKEDLDVILQSASSGNARDQDKLGDIYFAGRDVDKDYKQALYWYKKEAAQGISSAQRKVGIMYEMGYGVERNLKEAETWYNLAKQGHPNPEANSK